MKKDKQDKFMISNNKLSFNSMLGRFYALLYRSQLIYLKEHEYITYLVIWISSLQVITTVFQYRVSPATEDYKAYDKTQWQQFYLLFFYASKPYLLLQEIQYANEIVFSVFFIVISIFIVLFFYIVIIWILQKKIQPIFSQIVVTFGVFYNPFLQLLFTEVFTTFTLGNSLNSEKLSSPAIQISSIFFLLFSFLFSFLCCRYIEQSYCVENKNTTRSESSTTYVVLCFIKFMIGVIAGLSHFEARKIIQNSLCLLFFFLQFYELFTEVPFVSLNKFKNAGISTCFCFYSSLLLVFYVSLEIIDTTEFVILLIIGCPLAAKCTLILVMQKFNNTINNVFYLTGQQVKPKLEDHLRLEKKISFLVSNESYFKQQATIQIVGLIYGHKNKCLDEKCFCKEHLDKIMNINEDKQAKVLFTEISFQEFIIFLIRQDVESPHFQKKRFNKITFLRYQNYLSSTGKSTVAAKKLIDNIAQMEINKNEGIYNTALCNESFDIVKERMFLIYNQRITNSQVQESVLTGDKFILMKDKKDQLIKQINRAMQTKIVTLEKMRTSFESTVQVEQMNEQMNVVLEEVEAKLIEFYEQYPILPNFRFLTFFMVEIKGDLEKTEQLKKNFEFKKDFKNSDVIPSIDVFSPDVFTMTLTFGKVYGKIINFSSNLPPLLGYTINEFEYYKRINDLLPPLISSHHDQFINQFFDTGKENMIHNIRELIIGQKNGFITRIEGFVKMNMIQKEDLPFTIFSKILDSRSGFAIINNKLEVESISEVFLEKVGFTDVESLPLGIKFQAKLLVPNIETIVEEIEECDQSLKRKEFFQHQFLFPGKNHPVSQFYFYNQQAQEAQKLEEKQLKEEEKQLQMEKKDMKKSTRRRREQSSKNSIGTVKSKASKYGRENSLFSQKSKVSLMQRSRTQKSVISTSNIKSKKLMRFLSDFVIEKREFIFVDGVWSYYTLELKHVQDMSSGSSIASSKKSVDNHQRKEKPADFEEDVKSNRTVKMMTPEPSQLEKDITITNNETSLLQKVSQQDIEQQPMIKNNSEKQQKSEKKFQFQDDVPNIEENQDLEKSPDQFGASPTNDQAYLIPCDNIEQLQLDNRILSNNEYSKQDEDQTGSIKKENKNDIKKLFLQKQQDGQHAESVAQSSQAGKQLLEKQNVFTEIIGNGRKTKSLNILLIMKAVEYIVLLLTSLFSLLLIYSFFDQIMINVKTFLIQPHGLTNYANYLQNVSTFTKIYPDFETQYQLEVLSHFRELCSESFVNYKDLFLEDYQDEDQATLFSSEQFPLFDIYDEEIITEQDFTFIHAITQVLTHMNNLIENGIELLIDSPFEESLLFLKLNYLPFYRFYNELTTTVHDNNKEYIDSVQNQIITLTVILNLVTMLVFSISIFWNYYFQKDMIQFLLLVQTASLIIVEGELQRFKDLQLDFKSYPEMASEYYYDRREKERQLQDNQLNNNKTQSSKSKGQNNTGQKRSSSYVQVKEETISCGRFLYFTVAFYIIFLAFSITNYIINFTFFTNIQPAIDYYENYANVQTRIPSVLAFQSFKDPVYAHLFTQSEQNEINTEFQKQLQAILDFIDSSMQIKSISFFNNISDTVEEALGSNICEEHERSYDYVVCAESKKGLLTRGALQTFSSMHQELSEQIQLDFSEKFNTVEEKQKYLIQESYNSMLINRGMNESITIITDSIIKENQNQRNYVLILSILFMIIVTLGYSTEGYMQTNRMLRKFYLVKKIINIMPIQNVIVDDTLCKRYKAISKKLDISQ